MKSPIIGIIGRSRMSDTGYSLIATPESERMAVIASGGNPILIMPPQLVEYQKCLDGHPTPGELARLTDIELEKLYSQIDLCDGIILPGGEMMFEYDRKVCEYCYNNDIPLLGICMGMQVMCNYDKPVELKKIDTNINHKDLENDYVHSVKINKNSKLYEIIGLEKFTVNSRHNYQIVSTGKLDINTISEDGVIEGVEDKNKKFFIGVQWHPEINYDTDTISKKIFDSFIDKCK
jgi:gamma-glutamyl-gamma-aminobutyrate hydrolase PuuD